MYSLGVALNVFRVTNKDTREKFPFTNWIIGMYGHIIEEPVN